jgi:hypothetical protein
MCSGGSDTVDKAKRKYVRKYEVVFVIVGRIFKAMEMLNFKFYNRKNKMTEDICLRIMSQLTSKFQARNTKNFG